MMFSVIDLFAGAGGLSNGFEQTGNFDIKVAVEIDKSARKTYKLNHSKVEMLEDIKKINFQHLNSKYNGFDFVIGGPPCQGFSNANRQKSSLICGNNALVKEYIRAIECIKPKAFVMENVKTMKSDKHKFFCNSNSKIELEELQIDTKCEKFTLSSTTELKSDLIIFINNKKSLLNYIIDSKALSELKTLLRYKNNSDKFLDKIKKTKIFYNSSKQWIKLHKKYWNRKYKHIFLNLHKKINGITYSEDITDIIKDIKCIVEVQKTFTKINEIRDNNIIMKDFYENNKGIIAEIETYNVYEYVIKRMKSLGYKVKEDILNAADFGVPQVRHRLCIIGIKEELLEEDSFSMPKPNVGKSEHYTIREAIFDLEEYNPWTSLEEEKDIIKIKKNLNNKLSRYLNDITYLSNFTMTKTTDIAKKRFSLLRPGENFHNLDDSMKSTYSQPNRTQSTIYKRLEYDISSPTVTNVRKSMWIHPTKDRAITIREAARLQSFKDSYKFTGNKNSQYQQVGNAVPPLLARAIAENILSILNIHVNKSIIGKI